jgi:magnesium transporter
MLGRLIQPELEELISQRNWRTLREVLLDLSVPDIADVLSDVSELDRALVFRVLPRQIATEVFEYLDPDRQQLLLSSLKDAEAASILNDMAPDDRTELLEELPAQVARRYLRLLAPAELETAQKLLAYPESSVGRRMTPNYVKVKQHLTCGQCVDFLRHVGREKETVNYVYVVDQRNKPLGVVSLAELVFAPASRPVSELLEDKDDLVAIRADADEEEAVNLLKHYDVLALPVVDREGLLVGIVTFDDLMDVQEEAATESIQLMSGVVPTESSYVTTRLFDVYKSRLLALVLLAFTGTFAGKVLKAYEDEFSDLGDSFRLLTLFIVVIMSASGNTGSQAGTLVIRAMAIGEVKPRDLPRLAGREVLLGSLLGIVLGLEVALLGIFAFEGVDLATAGTVGLALACAVTACNMLGALLPLGLKALRVDPAFFANPLITTLSDYLSLTVFFELSRTLLA